MKTSGSMRNDDQLKSLSRAVVKVSTFTTESWAFAYQPSHTRVKVRKP